MWGTFLSEPLRIVASVGRYPTDKLMRRMPIPVRIAPFLQRGCPLCIYAGLARVSPGCPPDRGRLHTCYSPVRRSPAGSASTPSAAPRLACVKPAASVHPEPGSNSPRFIFFLIFQFVCSGCLCFQVFDGSRLPVLTLFLTLLLKLRSSVFFPSRRSLCRNHP